MRVFIKRLIFYLLPIVVIMGCFEIYLLKQKELTPIEEVVEKQLKSTKEVYFFREFFSSSTPSYKVMMAKRKKADILIVGQSTVLEFRDFMFHPYEKNFYNMGRSISNVFELESLINLIEQKEIYKPKFILLGLDLSLVKPDVIIPQQNQLTKPFKDEIYDFKYHVSSMQLMTRNWFQKSKKTIGINSNLGYGYWGTRGTGFRKDGSMSYAETVNNNLTNGKGDDQYKAMVKNKISFFGAPYALDPAMVKRFLSILHKIQHLNIQLLVFLPPLSDDFFRYITSEKKLKQCINAYIDLQWQLKKRGIKTIDFTTPKKIGLNDDYMLDSIHPGEVYVGTALYNYLSTVSKDDFLATIDKSYLKKQLDDASTNSLSFMQDPRAFATARFK